MTGRSAFSLLLMVLAALGGFATAGVSSSEQQSLPPSDFIKVGTYWQYAYQYERYSGDIQYSGNITMHVASEEQMLVSGDMTVVFVVDLLGSGQIWGDWFGNPVTGTLNFAGEDVRLKSNFSIVSEHFLWDEYMDYSTGTIDVTSSGDISYEPAKDDIIGDENLAVGENVTSTSLMTVDQWMNDTTTNETQSGQNTTSLTFTLVAENDIVTTPAGSFFCDKYAVLFQSEENEMGAYWYYSDKVGNYVKSVGEFSWMFGLVPITDLELRSYSYSTDNVPPVANAGTDQTVKVGDTVTFVGSASSDDVGIVSYNWSFVDTAAVNFSGEIAYHVFLSEGVYPVILTVSDAAGNLGWDNMTVTVERESGSLLESNAVLIGGGIAAAAVVVAAALLLLRKRKGKGTPDTSESFVSTTHPE